MQSTSPAKYESLEVLDLDFINQGKSYAYKDVSSVFYCFKTTGKLGRSSSTAWLGITMVDGTKLSEKAHDRDNLLTLVYDGLVGTKYPHGPSLALARCGSLILKKTFRFRFERCLQQLVEYGKYIHDGVEFFRDGKIRKGETVLDIRTCDCSRYNFSVTLKAPFKPYNGLIKKIFSSGSDSISIDLRSDKDVFDAFYEYLHKSLTSPPDKAPAPKTNLPHKFSTN